MSEQIEMTTASAPVMKQKKTRLCPSEQNSTVLLIP